MASNFFTAGASYVLLISVVSTLISFKLQGCDNNGSDPVLDSPGNDTTPEPMPVKGAKLASGKFGFQRDGEDIDYIVQAPSGLGPFPVVFTLHGKGAPAQSALDHVAFLRSTHILVAPDTTKDWSNVKDTSIVHTHLLNHVATFANVEPIFKFFGYSQGSNKLNEILMTNNDPRIIAACGFVSQLGTQNYREGKFWDAYNNPKEILTKRFYLGVLGGQDTLCPPGGGRSAVGTTFLQWESSAFRLAQGMGYTGGKLPSEDTRDKESVSYMDGQVQQVVIKDKGHKIPTDMRFVVDFMTNPGRVI